MDHLKTRWDWRKDRGRNLTSKAGSPSGHGRFQLTLKEEVRSLRKQNRELREEIKRRAMIEQELMERHNALNFVAHHDPLTGLPNRRHLIARLENLLGNADAASDSFAVGFMDLDDFKSINDNFGHAAGDLVLLETAKRLQGLTSLDLVVGRLAGDEFLIITKPIKSKTETLAKIESITEAVQKPIMLTQNELQVSASLGFACYPQPATDLQSLLTLADEAMYRAKSDHSRHVVISNGPSGPLADCGIGRRRTRDKDPRAQLS